MPTKPISSRENTFSPLLFLFSPNPTEYGAVGDAWGRGGGRGHHTHSPTLARHQSPRAERGKKGNAAADVAVPSQLRASPPPQPTHPECHSLQRYHKSPTNQKPNAGDMRAKEDGEKEEWKNPIKIDRQREKSDETPQPFGILLQCCFGVVLQRAGEEGREKRRERGETERKGRCDGMPQMSHRRRRTPTALKSVALGSIECCGLRAAQPAAFWALVLFLFVVCVNGAREEVRCGSVDIRNTPTGTSGRRHSSTTASLRRCTIVEGDFTMSMISRENLTDVDFPIFDQLREITGSLLVFQVRGLSSLGKMFPNLRVIGGEELIMNYALVVYQNQDLRDIGLSRLSIIKNGGIRIADNVRLCYTRNINWNAISSGDIFLDAAESHCLDECTVLDEAVCYRTQQNALSCWNETSCQTFCPHRKYDNGTFGPGCTDDGKVCHPYCMGGCRAENDPGSCHTCRYVEINGVCARECPYGMFELYGRRCLTKERCLQLAPFQSTSGPPAVWKPFNGKCHYDCPAGYEENPENAKSCIKCAGHCPKKCRGETVDSIGAALKFRECNIIEGSLEIEIRVGSDVNAEKFTEAFSQIEEITGYLMIRFSSVFVSLHMFKSLKIIHGEHLWRDASLIIFDNQNLRELFSPRVSAELRVLSGKAHFQNNRMLCYKKIESFLKQVDLYKLVTDMEISTYSYSNGDKAVCDEVQLEVEVASVYPNGFAIRWVPFNTSDMDYRKFIGYQIFYKKVASEDQELSIDDDRSACADTWKMHFTEVETPDHLDDESGSVHYPAASGAMVGQGVEPNTLYAFYVQTRIVNHPGARNAISKIHFVRTHFGTPSPPRMRTYRAMGAHSIRVDWDVPASPQGVITHYTVEWERRVASRLPETINPCSDDDIAKRFSAHHHSGPKLAMEGTCSRVEGCCQCSDVLKFHDFASPASAAAAPYKAESNAYTTAAPEMTDEQLAEAREEMDAFENAIQDKVFVQRCSIKYDPRFCGPQTAKKKGGSTAAAPRTPADHAAELRLLEELMRGTRNEVPPRRLQPRGVTKRRRRHSTIPSNGMEWRGAANEIAIDAINAAKKAQRKRRALSSSPTAATDSKVPTAEDHKVLELLRNDSSTETPDMANSTAMAEEEEEENDEESLSFLEILQRTPALNITGLNVRDPAFPEEFEEHGRVNVTGRSFVIAGLNHFTEYVISVYACQNVSEPDNSCSSRPVWVTVRTAAIPENDQVDNTTIRVMNITNGAAEDRRLVWASPLDPNGEVVAYKAKLFRDGVNSTPLVKCINITEFKQKEREGIQFRGLADGLYSVEIRAVTLAGMGPATLIVNAFEMANSTPIWRVILLVTGILLLTFIFIVLLYFYLSRAYRKKHGQIMSANPDYDGDLILYQKDGWELERSSLEIKELIGAGTFGEVYRGIGNNLVSFCGEEFGECAVKTPPAKASHRERQIFLLEASLMKKFNTSFIVKLYGVVSDAPILVVMEMMANGNLRDYLLARRPGNTEELAIPSVKQFFDWAAQVADGMAYLETDRFVHRDLAARNVMLHADLTAKIGDFGMTRDVYYHEYYVPAGKQKMPLRWMAPESMMDGHFTVKSDVWSYGVLIYEIITMGAQPYPGMSNEEVFNFVAHERRTLECPRECPRAFSNLMTSCWEYTEKKRPSFWDIVLYLELLVDGDFHERSYVVNCPEFKEMKQYTEGGQMPYHFGGAHDDDDSQTDEEDEETTEEDEEEEESDKEEEETEEENTPAAEQQRNREEGEPLMKQTSTASHSEFDSDCSDAHPASCSTCTDPESDEEATPYSRYDSSASGSFFRSSQPQTMEEVIAWEEAQERERQLQRQKRHEAKKSKSAQGIGQIARAVASRLSAANNAGGPEARDRLLTAGGSANTGEEVYSEDIRPSFSSSKSGSSHGFPSSRWGFHRSGDSMESRRLTGDSGLTGNTYMDDVERFNEIRRMDTIDLDDDRERLRHNLPLLDPPKVGPLALLQARDLLPFPQSTSVPSALTARSDPRRKTSAMEEKRRKKSRQSVLAGKPESGQLLPREPRSPTATTVDESCRIQIDDPTPTVRFAASSPSSRKTSAAVGLPPLGARTQSVAAKPTKPTNLNLHLKSGEGSPLKRAATGTPISATSDYSSPNSQTVTPSVEQRSAKDLAKEKAKEAKRAKEEKSKAEKKAKEEKKRLEKQRKEEKKKNSPKKHPLEPPVRQELTMEQQALLDDAWRARNPWPSSRQ